MRVCTLRRWLNGYPEPDTSVGAIGTVSVDRYEVLEELSDGDSDFALLAEAIHPKRSAWICTRWKSSVYADIADIEPPTPTPESALVALLDAFAPYNYSGGYPRYPWPLPEVTLPQAPPDQNNCCTFVEALVIRACEDAGVPFEWSLERHNQMMITGSDRFSPVTALVQAGLARSVDEDALPGPWSVIQGWRTDGGGHTFIVVDSDPDTNRVLILESNMGRLNGVGYRNIDRLDQLPENHPSRRWFDAGAPTWTSIKQKYPARRVAQLNVSDIQWIARGRLGLEGVVQAFDHPVVIAAGTKLQHHPDCSEAPTGPARIAAKFDADLPQHDCFPDEPWGRAKPVSISYGWSAGQRALLDQHAAEGHILILHGPFPDDAAEVLARWAALASRVILREPLCDAPDGVELDEDPTVTVDLITDQVAILPDTEDLETRLQREPAAAVVHPGDTRLWHQDGVLRASPGDGIAVVRPAGIGGSLTLERVSLEPEIVRSVDLGKKLR